MGARRLFWLIPVLLAAAACIAVIAAVCWHAVEEIHYLKSFYPSSFTVREAFLAAVVELIKVFLISLPLLLVLGVCLFVLRRVFRRP